MTSFPGSSEKVVILLEHPGYIEEYLKIRNSLPDTHILIATIPDVCWELEKRSIPYHGIEEYYDSEQIYSLGMENYKIVEKICNDIDLLLREFYPELDEFGFRPARDNFYFFKIFFDA